jgi:hypothetical protein
MNPAKRQPLQVQLMEDEKNTMSKMIELFMGRWKPHSAATRSAAELWA